MERVRAVLGLINETGILVVFHDEAFVLENGAPIRYPAKGWPMSCDGR